MEQATKFLKPEIVAQLANMELRARLVVEGFMTGLHRSPYHGFSVEFTEHRPYMPGDDTKRIDWKALGKTGRYYVKQFEDETNLKSYLLVDASRSMIFSSAHRVSKLDYATTVAAALAHLMIEQRDAVGLAVYDERVRTYLPPRSARLYLKQIFSELDALRGGEATNTAASLNAVAEQIKRRGLVIILSDLLDEPERVMKALKHFRHRGHEVIVMQILDPLERTFAFGADALFRDLETQEEMMTQPWHIQRAYQSAIRSFLKRYERECREANIDYVLLDTQTPFDRALVEYLTKRKRIH
ncbi:MAG: DUF58 domain-containing protein [Ignavibacteria bacterium]|nr:DUF58 domain-containing protein [Ignavibacteria bacterium]